MQNKETILKSVKSNFTWKLQWCKLFIIDNFDCCIANQNKFQVANPFIMQEESCQKNNVAFLNCCTEKR